MEFILQPERGKRTYSEEQPTAMAEKYESEQDVLRTEEDFTETMDENFPAEDGWSLDSNGNETYGIPISKGENGNLWVVNIEVLEDKYDDCLAVRLPDGTVEKVPNARKVVRVGGQTFNVWEEWKNSDKCRMVIEAGELRLTPNLSRDDDGKVQAIKAKENDPIVYVDYDEAMKLATELGNGEYELMHDAEYSIDCIYQIYVKKDKSIKENLYWLWVQIMTNESLVHVLVVGNYCNLFYQVGSRVWTYDYNSYNISLRASRVGGTVH